MQNKVGKNINDMYWFQHKDANKIDYLKGYPTYVGTYSLDDIYEEHAMKYVSSFSKNKGVCRTFFKTNKITGSIVDWRYEGNNEDCIKYNGDSTSDEHKS